MAGSRRPFPCWKRPTTRARHTPRWTGSVHNFSTYLKAGKIGEAAALVREDLALARESWPAGSLQLATQLASAGYQFLELKRYAEAEPLLRECLTIREKTQADVWTTFSARSLLGDALLGQKKYADAEPLLVKGYQGMKERAAKMLPKDRVRLTEAAQRLVRLYDAWDRPEEAAKWRKELEAQTKAAEKDVPSKTK